MSQTQLDTSTHLSFQLSLLRLSAIPGENGSNGKHGPKPETRQLEALVEHVLSVLRP